MQLLCTMCIWYVYSVPVGAHTEQSLWARGGRQAQRVLLLAVAPVSVRNSTRNSAVTVPCLGTGAAGISLAHP